MRSDKMSSIYSAEVRNEFTTPDHHAGMRPGPLLFRGVLDLQSSRRMLMRSPFWVTDINKELLGATGGSRDPISFLRATYTNGRISGLDLWILPNFLDF
jgi:hypothetical protein